MRMLHCTDDCEICPCHNHSHSTKCVTRPITLLKAAKIFIYSILFYSIRCITVRVYFHHDLECIMPV